VRRLVYFIVFVVVIVAIAYIVYEHRAWLGLSSAGGGVPTDVTNADLQPAHVSWRAVDRTQDGFRIDMPSDASEEQIPAYTANGGAEQMEMLVAMPTQIRPMRSSGTTIHRWSGRAAKRWRKR